MRRKADAKTDSDTRFEQAADWYLRLRGDLTPIELLEWEQWYGYPENREALEYMQRLSPLHGHLERPGLLSGERVQEDEYDGSTSVEEWLQNRSKRRSPSRIWFQYLAACVIGLGIFGAVLLAMRTWVNAGEPLHVYETLAGQHRDVLLSDGSQIKMGARTKLSTHYSGAQRVILLEDGEALFTVSKDSMRPFSVVAAGGTVTALGTTFNVRSDLNRVTVTVTDGVVEVSPSEAASNAADSNVRADARPSHWQPARLVKGQTVTYDEHRGRGSVATAGPEATEWVSGRLQYRQVPLKYVIADVQRYFNKTIVLGDEAAGEFEFTGTVYPADVGDWFLALEKIFPLDVSRANEHILIQSRADTSVQTHPHPLTTQ
jgi:transmembrane sensor